MGWTDWIGEVERNRDVLERILALLLALAGLADRASGLPAARRLHVLCFLAYGEAEARTFITGAFITGTASGPSDEAGDTAFPAADHAARLAASFRALALVLAAILARAEIRGQFTYFPRSRFRTRRAYRWEISKLSPYFPLHRAARGPPMERSARLARTSSTIPKSRNRERGFRSPRNRHLPLQGGRAIASEGMDEEMDGRRDLRPPPPRRRRTG